MAPAQTKSGLRIPRICDELRVSLPEDAPHVLLITLNRPRSLNAMTPAMTQDLNVLLNWFDDEPELWVAVLTGEGRAFCAGADLKAWHTSQSSGTSNERENVASSIHGFGSISRRSTSPKPLIAAVNGGAHGGGVEMILNCDLVVAADNAVLALPEVKRGVVAAQGVIPRIAAVAGHQLASEMLLTGRPITPLEARDRFRFVNLVVPQSQVLSSALDLARTITENSPDAVQSTKRALLLAKESGGSFERVVHMHMMSPEAKRGFTGENIKEGLRAFSEKRKPAWRNPAKL